MVGFWYWYELTREEKKRVGERAMGILRKDLSGAANFTRSAMPCSGPANSRGRIHGGSGRIKCGPRLAVTAVQASALDVRNRYSGSGTRYLAVREPPARRNHKPREQSENGPRRTDLVVFFGVHFFSVRRRRTRQRAVCRQRDVKLFPNPALARPGFCTSNAAPFRFRAMCACCFQ
jgi:hypothetical protein